MIEIERSVQQLHNMGMIMHEHLSSQTKTIERIQDKTERVLDATLEATLKSSRIIQQYNRQQGEYLGEYQFIADCGKYLCAEGQYLTLRIESAERSSYFRIYRRQAELIGIQNAKTLKFLGVTMFGSICVSGEYWGKMEDCFADLSGISTGILVLSRNWGSGGWIKSCCNSDGTITGSTNHIADKTDTLMVRAIKIAEHNSGKTEIE